MNRPTKSLLTIAAGTALLLGSGGTLAAWYGESVVAPSTHIGAGSLTLSSPSAGTWTDQTGQPITPKGFRVAPGDTLTYVATLDLSAQGDNLLGNLDLEPASIRPTDAAKPEDVALATRLLESATVTVDGRTGTRFTSKQGPQTVRVVITVVWPDGTTAADNAAQRGSVVLDDVTFTVVQALP